jgi:hypothetical protein
MSSSEFEWGRGTDWERARSVIVDLADDGTRRILARLRFSDAESDEDSIFSSSSSERLTTELKLFEQNSRWASTPVGVRERRDFDLSGVSSGVEGPEWGGGVVVCRSSSASQGSNRPWPCRAKPKPSRNALRRNNSKKGFSVFKKESHASSKRCIAPTALRFVTCKRGFRWPAFQAETAAGILDIVLKYTRKPSNIEMSETYQQILWETIVFLTTRNCWRLQIKKAARQMGT